MKVNRTDQGEPLGEHSWPRNKVNSVECRRRDLVIRVTDWTRDRDEPAFDVEVYVAGVYDWNESKSFLTRNATCQGMPRARTRAEARDAAVMFAKVQVEIHRTEVGMTAPEYVGRYARSVESGWLGKVVAVEGEGIDLLCKMQGVDELFRAIKGGPIDAALCENDIQWFTPDDLQFLTLV